MRICDLINALMEAKDKDAEATVCGADLKRRRISHVSRLPGCAIIWEADDEEPETKPEEEAGK